MGPSKEDGKESKRELNDFIKYTIHKNNKQPSGLMYCHYKTIDLIHTYLHTVHVQHQ